MPKVREYTAKSLCRLITQIYDGPRFPLTASLATWFSACEEREAFLAFLGRRDRADEMLGRYPKDPDTAAAIAYIRDHLDFAPSRIARDLAARKITATAGWVARVRRLISVLNADFEAFVLEKSKR